MTEHCGDSAPSRCWSEKAPFLGKWLWVLFWMVIPQALASLLMSDFFAGQPALTYLGQALQIIYLLGCGLVLLKLSSALERYRVAGICYLAACAVSLLSLFLPAPETGSALAVFTSIVSSVSGLALLVGEYMEYRSHSELLEEVDQRLSRKWRILWRFYIACFLVLLCTIVVMLLSPILGFFITMAALVGLMAVLVVKLIYLYCTAMIFRRWDAASPARETSSPPEDPWDAPEQS